MKKLVFLLVFVTSLFFSWGAVSGKYSLRGVCSDLSRYARNPRCIAETVAIVPIPPENIWSGWAWEVRGGTRYVSYAAFLLALTVSWAAAVVFGGWSLLSGLVRKE